MTNEQIIKLVKTEEGFRAQFNFDGVQLDTPILGTWDKPLFFGKEIAKFLGYVSPKNALLLHVNPKYKTTLQCISKTVSYHEGKQVLISEPGLYSLAMNSNLPRAQIFQDKVYEVILPELRKYGQVSLRDQLTESMALLAIKDEELNKEREAKKVAEFRSLTLHKLCVNYQERFKTQIFYCVTSKVMARDNEFKIGGVDHKSMLKKRLAMYNTGNSGVHPELEMQFCILVEVANYKQMETRIKELLAPFRSKRHGNTENFNIHFKVLLPLINLVSENYNEEIDKLNDYLKKLLETQTLQYIEPEEIDFINLDAIPDNLNIEVTKRKFGSSTVKKVKVSDLTNDELMDVLKNLLSTKLMDELTVRRTELEQLLEATFIISSNKRRIWDIAKSLIEERGKVPKY